MTPRATTYAVVILLVTLGVIFVLVGESGVSTGVYLPDQPTSTPEPTIGPSPTPLPDPSVENWQENAPGQLTYIARPESRVQLLYNTTTLETFVRGMGAELPPADDPYPLLTALQSLRDSFEEQIAELGLSAGPEALDGPATELVGGVPFSRLRVRLDPQTDGEGNPFSGLDLVIGLIDRPGDEVEVIQYRLQGAPDPAIYQDFRAWLAVKAAELAGSESGDEAAPEEEPAEDATEEPSGEAGDEGAGATATPTAEPTPVAMAPGEAAGPWSEVAEGVLLYTADPAITAQVAYRSMPVQAFIADNGFATPAADDEAPMLDLLTQLRDSLAAQLGPQGVELGAETDEGPAVVVLAGQPAARLRIRLPAQTLAGGQPFPGMDLVIILIDVGDEQLTAIQYTYQGAPEASVYPAFETWLDEHVAAIAVPDPAAAQETDG